MDTIAAKRLGSTLVGMCGRFSQFSSVNDLVTYFSVDETLVATSDVRRRFNVAPTQPVLVVTCRGDDHRRVLGQMRWGLVPSWAKDLSIGSRMINARSDKLASSNAYRAAFARRRCIIPVDGFYEWSVVDAAVADGPLAFAGFDAPGVAATVAKPAKPVKQPFHIHRGVGGPLALAGLWETWHDAQGVAMRSCTIITTDANAQMAPIHHRMPVILAEDDWSTWLGPERLSDGEAQRLLAPAPSGGLVFDAVSREVNRPVNDYPSLVEPLAH